MSMQVKRKSLMRVRGHNPGISGQVPADRPGAGLLLPVGGREAGNQLIKIIRGRIEAVRDLARQTAMNPEPDGIHDVRVASRRATECLGIVTAGRMVNRSHGEAVVRLLRKMRRRGGELRDMDVFLYDLSARKDLADGKAVAALNQRVAGRRSRAIRAFIKSAMVVAINPRVFGIVSMLDQRDLPVLRESLYRGLIRRIKRNRKRLLLSLNEALSQGTVGAMHQARIAGKRMRYVCEIGDAAALTETRLLRDRLRMFQKIAGELNDAAGALGRLEDFDPPPRTIENSGDALTRKLRRIHQSRVTRLTPRAMTQARSLYRLLSGMNLPSAKL